MNKSFLILFALIMIPLWFAVDVYILHYTSINEHPYLFAWVSVCALGTIGQWPLFLDLCMNQYSTSKHLHKHQSDIDIKQQPFFHYLPIDFGKTLLYNDHITSSGEYRT